MTVILSMKKKKCQVVQELAKVPKGSPWETQVTQLT